MWNSSRAIAGGVAALTLLMPSAAAAGADTAGADTTEPRFKTVLEDYWFHGDPNDRINRQERLLSGVVDTPFDSQSPTFDQSAPTGDEPVAQSSYLSEPVPTVQTRPGEPWATYWVGDIDDGADGDVAHEVDGDLEIRWFWRSAVPQPGPQRVHITVWADPDWESGTGTLIGGDPAAQINLDPPPTEVVTKVPVQGTVEDQLVIQVTWSLYSYLWTVVGLAQAPLADVLYDSTEFDSGFTVPFRVPCEDNDPDPECAPVEEGEAASNGSDDFGGEFVDGRPATGEPVDMGGWSMEPFDGTGTAVDPVDARDTLRLAKGAGGSTTAGWGAR